MRDRTQAIILVAIILAFLGLCSGAGCDGTASGRVEKDALDYYQKLDPPAKMTDTQLAEQEKTDKAVAQVALSHLKTVQQERKERWIATIKTWCRVICIIALLAGIAVPVIMVVAFKLPIRIAAYVGAGLLTLSGLAGVFSWTLSHLLAIGIAAGIIAVVVVVYEILAHWRKLKAMAQNARRDVEEEFTAKA